MIQAPESEGAKPLRSVFSLTHMGSMNWVRYSGPPAFEPIPDILKPPKGCLPTRAPVMPRLIYRLPTWNSSIAFWMLAGLRE